MRLVRGSEPDLDAAAADPRLEPGLRLGRGTVYDAAVAKVEYGIVPGTLHVAVPDLSLIERTALPAQVVLQELTFLSLKGQVRRVDGQTYTRRR